MCAVGQLIVCAGGFAVMRRVTWKPLHATKNSKTHSLTDREDTNIDNFLTD